MAEEILDQANELNADLIVMGTHGHGAMYNLLVGSVTKGVLKHSTWPVLLVPGPKRSYQIFNVPTLIKRHPERSEGPLDRRQRSRMSSVNVSAGRFPGL